MVVNAGGFSTNFFLKSEPEFSKKDDFSAGESYIKAFMRQFRAAGESYIKDCQSEFS
jgi:hypothetical protein